MAVQFTKQKLLAEKINFLTIIDAARLSEILVKTNEDTLVVFDVDMVLLNTKEIAFQIPNLDLHNDIVLEIKSRYTQEEFDYLVHCALVQIEFELLHPLMSVMVNGLQDRNVPTMACTALLSGLIELKYDMMEWRTNQLAEFGIDFSKTAPDESGFKMLSFPTYRGNVPEYNKGVMITNSEHSLTDKGMVLASLLSIMPEMPKKIVMIDDKLKNLEDVGNSLAQLGYGGDYLAIEFLAAKYVHCPLLSANEFKSEFQRLLVDQL